MYYVHFNGKSHGPYLLDQIRGMWERGLITADATYWAEGETEWKPVVHLLAPKIPVSSVTLPEVKDENTSLPLETPGRISSQSAKQSWNPGEPRPWRRMWARILDLQILVSMPMLLLASAWLHFVPNTSLIGIIAISIAVVLVLEPLCLWKFGSTPGKWLLGISVRKSDGNTLSLAEAFVRFLSVLCRLLIPFVSAVFMLLAYRDLRKCGTTKWDRVGGYIVTYRQVGIGRWSIAVILMVLIFAEDAFLRERFKKSQSLKTTALVEDIFLRNNPVYVSAKNAEEKDDYQAMLELARQLVQSYPNSGLAYKCLGDAYYYLGQHQNALNAINKSIEIKSDDVIAWHNLGDILVAMNRLPEAETAYKSGLKFEPDAPLLWADLGALRLEAGFKNRLLDEAMVSEVLHYLEPAEKRLIERPFNDYQGQFPEKWVWLSIAETYRRLSTCNSARGSGVIERAANAFERVTNLDPNYPYAWSGIGDAYYDLGRLQLSESAFNRAIALNVDYAPAWLGLGHVYNRLKRPTDAIHAFKNATRLNSKDSEAWFHLGVAFYNYRNYPDAVGALENATRGESVRADMWEMLGKTYEAQGNAAAAKAAFEQAREPLRSE